MQKQLLFLLMIVLSASLQAQQQDIKALDSTLTELNKTNRFNGTVLYAEKGKVLYKKAFGVADYRTNKPLNTTSAFNLASVTKQFNVHYDTERKRPIAV